MLCLFSYGLLSATQLTDEMNEWETETETDRTGLDAKLLPLYGRIESIQAKETVLSAKSLTKIPLCLLNVSEFFEMCQHFSKPRHNIFCQMSWRFGRSLEMQRAYHIQSFQLQHLNRFWHTIYLDSNLKCFVECILVVKRLKKISATSWNWPILFPLENRKQKKQHSPKYCHQFSNIFIMISFSPHWLTVLIFTQNIKCSENSHSSFSAIDIW